MAYLNKRKNKGYTLLELMVVVSVIGVVIGMLYIYNNRGWKLFNKSLAFGRLQTDARAALEQMSFNLKHTSPELVYTSVGYNSNVPLPQDYLHGKPYIYFAIPQRKGAQYKERDIKSKEKSSIQVPPYDYYLYYIAKAQNRDGDTTLEKARLKLFLIKNQDGIYTITNSNDWPLMPPKLLGEPDYEKLDIVAKTGQVTDIEYQDLSPEFSPYESEFFYNFFNTSYDKVFKIKVNMVDKQSNTIVKFETAVAPRG